MKFFNTVQNILLVLNSSEFCVCKQEQNSLLLFKNFFFSAIRTKNKIKLFLRFFHQKNAFAFNSWNKMKPIDVFIELNECAKLLIYRPKIKIGRCEKSHVVDEGNGLKVRNKRGI